MRTFNSVLYLFNLKKILSVYPNLIFVSLYFTQKMYLAGNCTLATLNDVEHILN